MDEYYQAIQALPAPLRDELSRLPAEAAGRVQEIRLRARQPVLLTMGGQLVPCTRFLPGCRQGRYLSGEAVQQCFLALCGTVFMLMNGNCKKDISPFGREPGGGGRGARAGRLCGGDGAQPAHRPLGDLPAARNTAPKTGQARGRRAGGRAARKRKNNDSAQHTLLPGGAGSDPLRGG